MKVIKVSCYSNCGTYFQPYLQSVTVIAESKEDAIERVRNWLRREGRSFIEKDWKKWGVEDLGDATLGVIDWHEDSDY